MKRQDRTQGKAEDKTRAMHSTLILSNNIIECEGRRLMRTINVKEHSYTKFDTQAKNKNLIINAILLNAERQILDKRTAIFKASEIKKIIAIHKSKLSHLEKYHAIRKVTKTVTSLLGLHSSNKGKYCKTTQYDGTNNNILLSSLVNLPQYTCKNYYAENVIKKQKAKKQATEKQKGRKQKAKK